ncbi:MAG: N-6 DNA methylase [Vicingaceae bacterium]|nr:N-6 DNA methylase [Vicingaceae bacterium]
MIEKLYKAIEDKRLTVNEVSDYYHVNPRTVKRWLSGETKPKLELQYELSELLDENKIDNIRQKLKEENAKTTQEFDNLLKDLRESFYRWGNYSSRNEALEELSKLLLAQIFLIKENKEGFDKFKNCGTSIEVNNNFIELINSTIYKVLGENVITRLFDSHYKITLKNNQNELIREICSAFKKVNWANLNTITRLDLFNEIFGRFLSNSFVEEKEMGQYLTPIEMTRFMVELSLNSLTNKERDTLTHPINCRKFGYILDPSSGAGTFLIEVVHKLLPEVIEKHGKQQAIKWLENLGKYVLFAIDKSKRMIKLTAFNFCLLGLPCNNVFSINSLDIKTNKVILKEKLEGKVRLILTNPPFGAEFNGNELLKYKLFNTWTGRPPKKIESELLFIEKYVDWLVPNGNCVSVVPDSILTNRGLYYDLRRGIHPNIELNAVISFPSETFSAAGTSTKTSVISFVKTDKKLNNTYFGICTNIGYKVITKGSNKVKVATDTADLPDILNEILGHSTVLINGRFVKFDDSFHRWDANYHASLKEKEYKKINSLNESDVLLSDVAELVNERIDPRRVFKEFRYIEISDIQANGLILSKVIPSIDAPSRARKQVRKGDVLASTVRPEQKKIGYILSEIDNNLICTTGLAVLRPKGINPSLLVELLKSDFVTKQLLRNNIGIAYPAIDENCFLEVLLPIKKHQIEKFNSKAKDIIEKRIHLDNIEQSFKKEVNDSLNEWFAENKLV